MSEPKPDDSPEPSTAATGGDARTSTSADHPLPATTGGDIARTNGRWLLAAVLLIAGVGHFAAADTFVAQVPPWMPLPGAVIAVSGVVELALAAALVLTRGKRLHIVGWIVAAFFLVIFPGNLSQFLTGTDAFGLNSDAARFGRLLFQPVLIVWALWCTGAWRARRQGRSAAGAADA